MPTRYRLPNKAQWIQEQMQSTIDRILAAQQGINEENKGLVEYIQEAYSEDAILLAYIAQQLVYQQELNIQISLLQQMNHDLKTGEHKERNEHGHTIRPKDN